jgi:hypothetical protein
MFYEILCENSTTKEQRGLDICVPGIPHPTTSKTLLPTALHVGELLGPEAQTGNTNQEGGIANI